MLHVYKEESDTVIAESAEDAKLVWAECTGEPYDDPENCRGGEHDGFDQLDDGATLCIQVDDIGDLKCGSTGRVCKTAAQWCAQEGRGFLCSENF